MEKRIREIISENSGVTGVLLRDSVGKTITINEEVVFPSASLIKLFILMTLNKEDYNKKIELKKEDKVGGCGILKVMGDGLSLTVKDIAYLMICLSDNTATNILIDYIGMDKINSCIKEKGFAQISDSSELEAVVAKVLADNQKSVDDYHNGKTNALGFLKGQCMKATKGKGNPAMMKEMIMKALQA